MFAMLSVQERERRREKGAWKRGLAEILAFYGGHGRHIMHPARKGAMRGR